MATTNSVRTFRAIAYNEVLLNSKRVAPYAVMILFSALAVMGWSRGPAVALGWATNSDFYIARSLKAYSFLFGVPIFNAMIMGDAIIRDFRLGIDPLIFTKPLSRAQYLFGRFFGNFLVLICSIATYPLTLLALQAFHPSQMVVLPFKGLPYFTHFFFFVVITQLAFAAVFFMVGTLTRNNKLVYFLAISFYPIFISLFLFLFRGWDRGKILLDPFLLNSGPSRNGFDQSAEYLNQYVYSYTPEMILNRAGLILIAAVCLMILYRFFSTAEQFQRAKPSSFLNLSTAAEGVYYQQSSPDQFAPAVMISALPALPGGIKRTLSQGLVLNPSADADGTDLALNADIESQLLNVSSLNEGIRANVNRLVAAIGIEFTLLRAERSLVVVAPLAIFLSLLEVSFYAVHADVSPSAVYASNTATSLLTFLIGMAVFYTGEAMHRDREVRIEPFLWSTPAPNHVLILSKFLSTLLLLFALIASVGFAALAIQVIRQHTPIDLVAYLKVYGLILIPSAFILTALSVVGNVVLRNKYVFYVVSVGTASGLFYLYSSGYNHWLYNPTLYRLWSYSDLVSNTNAIVLYRLAWLAIAAACLLLSHLFFERRSRQKLNLPLPFALR